MSANSAHAERGGPPASTPDCRTCGAAKVVPVLDKRIERKMTGGGNKYRQYCLKCDSWQPSTSTEVFENHHYPHVLPVDGDPKDPDSVIPLTEYDYGPELAGLVDRINQRQAEPGPENEFECPVCGVKQAGYPETCDECGATYRWSDE